MGGGAMEGVVAVAMSPAAVTVAATLAVGSAFTYTFGLALQQKANLATPASSASGARTAVRVVLHPFWLAGFALGLVGFLMHGVALAAGSLTLVQVLQVSQIVFMVPLSAWVAHVALRRQDWLGGALVAVGLVGLLVAGRPGDDTRAGGPVSWTIAMAAAAAVVMALVIAARGSPWRAPILGAAAGVVFGVEAATLKVASDNLADGVSWSTLLGPATWATLAAAVVGPADPEPGPAGREPRLGAGQPHHQLARRVGCHRRLDLRRAPGREPGHGGGGGGLRRHRRRRGRAAVALGRAGGVGGGAGERLISGAVPGARVP